MKRALGIAALLALAAFAFGTGAEQLKPSVATTFAVGDGGAAFATDRGPAARNGRVSSLPSNAKLRWSVGVGTRLDWPAVVDAKGRAVVAATHNAEGVLVELELANGKAVSVTKLRTAAAQGEPALEGLSPLQADAAAGPVVLLASGTRVVVTIRGWALGVAPGGSVVFRTRLGGELSSVPRVGVVPLPGGGFAVARRPEVLELDAHGNVVDRVRLELSPYLAARENGEVLGVTPNGELFGVRAGRLPHRHGSFSEKGASTEGPCRGGLVLDGSEKPAPGGRRERAVCVSDRLVEQVDLASGVRKALLGDAIGKLPYRAAPALAKDGTLVTPIAGGALVGLAPQGGELGPWDLPGSVPAAAFGGKDGGTAFVGSVGEVAPLVADDGAVAWGSSDGVGVLRAGVASRVGRCAGFASNTLVGLSGAGPNALLLACADGKLQLVGD
jgi:hypothetical protein